MSKFKVENGELRIDLIALAESLSEVEHRSLARALIAEEQLFKAVLECVADDSQNGFGHYFNDEDGGPWWFAPRTVLEMRQKLIPLMSEIAASSVREALRQRDAAIAERDRHSAWAWRMHHAWPECSLRGRPELASPAYNSPCCRTCGMDMMPAKAECREQKAEVSP